MIKTKIETCTREAKHFPPSTKYLDSDYLYYSSDYDYAHRSQMFLILPILLLKIPPLVTVPRFLFKCYISTK